MQQSLKNYMDKRLRYVYSFKKHAGANGVAIKLGTIPDQFLVTRLDAVCVLACTSLGSATYSVGDTDSATLYMNAQALSVLDTIGKVYSLAQTSLALRHTANQKNFLFTIGTADLTAGGIEFYLAGLTPVLDVTTLAGA